MGKVETNPGMPQHGDVEVYKRTKTVAQTIAVAGRAPHAPNTKNTAPEEAVKSNSSIPKKGMYLVESKAVRDDTPRVCKVQFCRA